MLVAAPACDLAAAEEGTAVLGSGTELFETEQGGAGAYHRSVIFRAGIELTGSARSPALKARLGRGAAMGTPAGERGRTSEISYGDPGAPDVAAGTRPAKLEVIVVAPAACRTVAVSGAAEGTSALQLGDAVDSVGDDRAGDRQREFFRSHPIAQLSPAIAAPAHDASVSTYGAAVLGPGVQGGRVSKALHYAELGNQFRSLYRRPDARPRAVQIRPTPQQRTEPSRLSAQL